MHNFTLNNLLFSLNKKYLRQFLITLRDSTENLRKKIPEHVILWCYK